MRLVNAQMADAIDTSFDVPQLNGSRRARNVAVTTAGGKNRESHDSHAETDRR